MFRRVDSAVGRSDDELAGMIFSLLIILVIVSIIISVICTIGACIGGFHSIKNYVLAFKENVIDANRIARAA